MSWGSVTSGAKAGPITWVRGPAGWLAGVGLALTVTAVAAGVRHGGVGWDEALYVSQVSPRIPAAFFSAPRARGITYLIAPAVWVTGSLTALRVYLAVLAGVGVVLAYRPWLPVVSRPAVVPLAAFLFCGLWVTGYYAAEVIPNFWVALSAVALAGWFVRYATSGGRTALIGTVAAGAVAALMRPGDAFWIVLPLPAAALLVRAWRRPGPVLAAAAGTALGAAEWIAEAYLNYGGPLRRLKTSAAVEGGFAWNPHGALHELDTLNGQLLCRPCGGGVAHPALALWWPAVPLLAACGLVLAARAGRIAPAAVAAACGVAASVPYLLLLGYAAPRFLLPGYALLALPVAEFLIGLPAAVPRLRRPLAGVLCLLLAAHVAGQAVMLVREARDNAAERAMYARGAAALRRLGLHAPCLLSGSRAVPVAFYLHCATEETGGVLRSTGTAAFLATARRERTGILTAGRPPRYAAAWVAHPLSSLGRHWRVYLPPWQPARPR